MCLANYDVVKCKIISVKEIAVNTFDFVITCEQESREFIEKAKAGQFIHIYLKGRVLRRPISICDIDKQNGTLRIVFQIRGEGTFDLSLYKEGEILDAILPLGNGFTLEDSSKKALFVGGGIGVPPLLATAKHYGKNAVVALGFANKQSVILEEDFKAVGVDLRIATDDGSYGTKGLVTQLFKEEKPEIIYACGPNAMLKAVANFAKEIGAECQLSLEERMACGIGACLGCAVSLKGENNKEYFGHVCKDGPVFDYRKVVM